MTTDYRIAQTDQGEWAIQHPRLDYLYFTGREWRRVNWTAHQSADLIRYFDSESDARTFAQQNLAGKELGCRK